MLRLRTWLLPPPHDVGLGIEDGVATMGVGLIGSGNLSLQESGAMSSGPLSRGMAMINCGGNSRSVAKSAGCERCPLL